MAHATHHYNHPLTSVNRAQALADIISYMSGSKFDYLLNAITNITDEAGNPPMDDDLPSLHHTLLLQLDLILGISGYPARVFLEWLALPYADARIEIDHLLATQPIEIR